MWEIFSDGREPYERVKDLVAFLKEDNRLDTDKLTNCDVDIKLSMQRCWDLNPEYRYVSFWTYTRPLLREIVPFIEKKLEPSLLAPKKWLVSGWDVCARVPIKNWTEFVPPKTFIQISSSASGCFSLAVAIDGSVWSWGNNDHGQLGLGSISEVNKPQNIAFFGPQDPVINIHTGDLHAGVVTS